MKCYVSQDSYKKPLPNLVSYGFHAHSCSDNDSQKEVGQDERWLMFVTLRSPLEVLVFETESLSWDDQTSEMTAQNLYRS